MKTKDNFGCSAIDISRGYESLEGNPPYAGENIMTPRHVSEEKRIAKMMSDMNWPDEKEGDHGPDGFIERDLPNPYDRPNRSKTEDRG